MPPAFKIQKCRKCRQKTRFERDAEAPEIKGFGCLGHAVLCVLTLGLWLPVALILVGLGMIGNSARTVGVRYRCTGCGRPG